MWKVGGHRRSIRTGLPDGAVPRRPRLRREFNRPAGRPPTGRAPAGRRWLPSFRMNELFNGSARPGMNSARTELATLMASLGAAGLAAAAARPGLRAAVDQHAAAVRDSLLANNRPVGVVALAGYAEGVRQAALGYGWRPPIEPIDWSRTDWIHLRLLAICALARGGGCAAYA